MTEDEARILGKAIFEEVKILPVAMENEVERRAFCLKMAIETKGIWFEEVGANPEASVLRVARVYEAFVSGADAPKAAESEEAA
jgi:hypothetical protein